MKKLQQATDLIQESLDLNFDDVRACILLADLVRRQSWLQKTSMVCGLSAAAADKLERALSHGAQPEELHTRLGVMYQRWAEADPDRCRDLLGKAQAHFQEGRKLTPSSVINLLDMTWVLMDRASCEPEQARALLAEADQACGNAAELLQKDQEMQQQVHGWLWDVRGALHAAQARWLQAADGYEQANTAWSEATRLAPGEARSWTRWGWMLLEAANAPRPLTSLDEAEKKLRQARRYEPDRIAPRAGLAYLKLRRAVDSGVDEATVADLTELEELASYAPGVISYTLACGYGARGDAERCAQQLSIARRMGDLPPMDHVLREPCFARVRESAPVKAALAGWPASTPPST